MVLSATEKENEKKTLGRLKKGLDSPPKVWYTLREDKERQGGRKKENKKNQKKVLTDHTTSAIIKIQNNKSLNDLEEKEIGIMTKKMTKKDYFNELKNIPAVAENEALVNFIDHEIDLLNRKNTSSTGEKKMTATQKANEELKVVILEVLKAHKEPMTITEMMKADARLGELTNQKISAVIRLMLKEETVDRIEDKKKAMFKPM